MYLKSGTDVRGTAIETPEGGPVQLTDEAVAGIARAFLVWCERHMDIPAHRLKLAVGRDSRLSGPRIAGAIREALLPYGVTCYDCGLASTPSMFMAVLDIPCDCAVQITASHHPFHRNGLKFFTKDGGLDSPDLSEILALAGEGACPEEAPGGSWRESDHMEVYAAHLRDLIERGIGAPDYHRPLAGFHIAVDAGNGAGGFYADLVLKPLGADTTGSQFLEPDGNFPNHIPNPENEEAMQSVCKAVVNNKADFGIIFDTDVDRAGAVSPDGEEINRNRLIALISAILLEEQKGAYIVTDSVTSDGLAEFIAKKGGVHRRFKRGYKNVINESKRLNAEGKFSPLAIETSGHAALKENYFLDDGAYLVTKLLISLARLAKEGKNLLDLIKDLPEPAEAAEVRLKFETPDFKEVGKGIISDLTATAIEKPYLSLAPENCEGVRINFDKEHGNGWALVRMSLHEPILPVNAESNDKGGVKKILSILYKYLKEYPFLNTENLKKSL